MSNPGNRGHRGYKMSKVTAIGAENGMVVVSLACGHTDRWEPYYGYTAQEWAEHIQQGEQPFIIGQTRLRCEQCRDISPG